MSIFDTSRRDFLGRAGQLGAVTSLGFVAQAGLMSNAIAADKPLRPDVRSVSGPLPRRGEYLIRGAYVLTMDKAGDMPDADVHVKNGEIIAVGKGLRAPGAETIDARGMLVLPGLVETHWHMWEHAAAQHVGRHPGQGLLPAV